MKDFADLEKLDRHHIFNAVDSQPEHLRLNFADSMTDDITPSWGVGLENIVVAGMGGSVLAADLAKNWLSSRLAHPLEIVRGYEVPEYVGPTTLFVASSYSGNTEETLAALEQAEKRSARIIIMTAGGKLLEIAQAKPYLTLKLPQVSQPRLSFAGLKALTCVLADLGWIGDLDVRRELLDVANWLDVEKSRLGLDNLQEDNEALALARHLYGQVGLIYSGPALRAAAYKWKININENSKQLAFCNVYPELNHNEYQGWIFPKKKLLRSVQLQSSLDNERVQKRFSVTQETLEEHGFEPIVVHAKGQTHIQQLLWTVLLGDYTSAYLGILNGIDPTPVDLVERFKKLLEQ